MKKPHSVVILLILILLAGTIGVSMTQSPSQKAAFQKTSGPPSEPPTEVVYSALFHLVVELKQQAADLESGGKSGDSLRDYVKTQASLNDEEEQKLNEIAANCVEMVSQQDAKAIAVIQSFRSQFPGGKIPAGVKIPPPPPELKVAAGTQRNHSGR